MNFKRILAGVLSTAVIVSTMAACGGNGGNSSTSETSAAGSSSSAAEKEKMREIVYMYPSFGTIPTGLPQVEEAVNKITQEKINTKVKLNVVSYASFAQQMNLAVTSGEAIDVATVVNMFTTMVNQKQLIDMTDLLNTNGQGILDTVGDFVKGTTVDGKIYGVLTMQGKATSPHILMREDILKECGLTTDDIQVQEDVLDMADTFNKLETIFQAVKEKKSDMNILVSAAGVINLDALIGRDALGDNLGVTLTSDSGKVVNLYETEQYKMIVELARKWNEKGYIMPDAATNTEGSTTVLMAGKSFADLVPGTQQGVVAAYKQSTGHDFAAVKLKSPYITTYDIQAIANVLPVTCKEPEAAVDFLNLMFTDKELVNLFAYGIEGEHYVFEADGTVAYPEGVNASNSAYPCNQTWLFGNSLLDLVKVGNVPNLYEIQAKGNTDAPRSDNLGFTFDSSSVKSEVAACTNVVSEYKNGLQSGSLDPKTKLPEFIEKLKASGIEKIINEKQKQLDAWKAANK